MSFVGREQELSELNTLYAAKGAKLAVVYGRRRVGKSRLIEKFMSHKRHLHFDGLEGMQTQDQIDHFTRDLARQIDDPLLERVKFDSWSSVFEYLSVYLEKNSKEKIVVLFDEFQWLAVNQTKIVSLIKTYWDRIWSKQNVLLILCGSVSSYMVNKVIKSKALYGRVNWELCLYPLMPKEINLLLGGKRSQDEVMLYSMILGGIPKYLQEINSNQSLEQNINRLLFVSNALLSNEYEKIFYSQFKEHKTYEKIVVSLERGPLSLAEVAEKNNLTSSGGLKTYLDNLEKAAFITSYIPYDKNSNSKLIKYKLTDEYLRFYFKFIKNNIRLISDNRKANLFARLVKPNWQSWLGFAFENYCIKNAAYLSELMGFEDQVIQWGPYFKRGDQGFQIDLIYRRADKVITVCEIKYCDKPVGVEVVKEMERKCELLETPRGYTIEKALISRYGMDSSLQQLDYFHHAIAVGDFFNTSTT